MTHHILDLCSLLGLCLDQNFFKFNNEYYRQNYGLSMGSNLSPLLAEVFMTKLESTYITDNNPFHSNVLFWFRYVDDCLVLFDGNDTILNQFLNYLNSLHSKINFTLEIESNDCIAFLDLLISKKHGHFEYEIYRKPTQTDSIIPNHSCHPSSHKFSAFNSLFTRLFTLPLSNEKFKKEFNIIQHIAKKNGYKNHTIFQIFKKFSFKALNFNYLENTEVTKHFNCISYFGTPSIILSNIFKSFNINVAFRTKSTLNSYLVNTKDTIPPIHRSGVYKLKCNNCNSEYIGQTGRKFLDRVIEHERCFRLRNSLPDTPSSFANHILSEHHNFLRSQNFEILHFCEKGRLLDNLEILEICKSSNNSLVHCLNDCVEFSFNNFYNALDIDNIFQ